MKRTHACPICRERIRDGDDVESDNDSENGENDEQEFIVFGKLFNAWIIYVIGSYAWSCSSHGWRMIFPDSVEFISNSSQLEVLNGGKCIRNSGFDFWNERLKVLNGVAGRVPVRFLDSFDMEIEIHYRIKKDFEIGTIIFQIGFLPTKHMDKDRFIYDQGLAITALVRENNEVRLVISNFGASMKEERISDNKRDITFAGRLILRKLKHIISVYLKANESKGIYRERQELYFSTDLPNIPAPDGIYMHTFDNIDNYQEDLWPVFNVCKGSRANVVMSSKHFHEPSCNKDLFMSENGQSVSNSKQKGFMKCELKSHQKESMNAIFVQSKHDLFKPFQGKYNFSFELDFAKSFYSEGGGQFLFQINIVSPEKSFVIGVEALEEQIFVYMFNGNSSPTEILSIRSSSGLKKLLSLIEMNYQLRTIKLEILYPAENKRYSYEFLDIVYLITPYLYVAMSSTGITNACFS